MTDPTQRLNAWTIKADNGKVKQILDDMRPDMLKHYEAVVASLCEMETKARRRSTRPESRPYCRTRRRYVNLPDAGSKPAHGDGVHDCAGGASLVDW